MSEYFSTMEHPSTAKKEEERRRLKENLRKIQEFAVEQATDPLNYLPGGAAAKGLKTVSKGLFGLAGMEVANDANAMLVKPTKAPMDIIEAIRRGGITPEQEKEFFLRSGLYLKNGKAHRQYIPDQSASLTNKYRNSKPFDVIPIMQAIEHPELWGKAPANTYVMKDPILPPRVRGYYKPEAGVIGINTNINDPRTITDTLLHELQHYYQTQNKWPAGSSPAAEEKKLQNLFASNKNTKPSEAAIQKHAYEKYRRHPGEQEARLTQNYSQTNLMDVSPDRYVSLDELMNSEIERSIKDLVPFYHEPLYKKP